MKCDVCGKPRDWWHTPEDPITCAPCRRKQETTDYGLQFNIANDGTAEPTQEFWDAWRDSSDAVKRKGYVPKKTDGGTWRVHKLPPGEKERAKAYIDRRYARYTQHIGKGRKD